MNDRPAPWWGTFELELNSGGRWDVGPSTLWVFRTDNEWRIVLDPSAGDGSGDSMSNRSRTMIPASEEDMSAVIDGFVQVSRHSFRSTGSRIEIVPSLADRPIISRPEHPLFVPPMESATLYLSSPVWVRVQIPESGVRLVEYPSFRLSDTWFGPSTLTGELCYATRTSGRRRRDQLPLRMHRAITPLRIENRGTDALELARVQLPARHLSVFVSSDHELWTEAVTMTRAAGAEGAGVDIRPGPPADAKKATLLTGPRESTKRGLFTSTFGAVSALISP